MSEPTDIQSREDIYRVIKYFYDRLLQDDRVAYLFTDVAKIDLLPHLERITDFWEFILFGTKKYLGNVTQPHLQLHAKSPFSRAQFEVWHSHFNETIDQFHAGPKSDEMKSRAYAMGVMMQAKMGLLN